MIKPNATLKIELNQVLTPSLEQEVIKRAQAKYGENVKVMVTGEKISNNNFNVAKRKIKDNGLADLYKQYIFDNNIDVDIDEFMRVDGEISAHLQIKEFQQSRFNLKWVRSKNLLSFNDLFVDLDNQGIMRVFSEPHNRGGKSNLIRIIKILLFGEFYRNDSKTTLSAIMHKFSPLNYAYVEGEIEIEGETYSIKREFNKNGKGKVSQKLLVLKGKETIDNAKYESLVGDIKSFLFTSFFDTFSIEKWLNTKPTERYRLFINYFGLQVLEEKYKIAKTIYDNWLKNSKIRQYQHLNFHDEIQTMLVIVDKLTQENLSIDSDIAELQQQIQERRVKIFELTNKLKGIPDSFLFNNKESLNTDLILLQQKLTERQTLLNNVNHEDNQIFITETIEELEKQILLFQQELSQVVETKEHSDERALLNYMFQTYSLPLELKQKKEDCEKQIETLRQSYSNTLALKKAKEKEFQDTPQVTSCGKCGEITDNKTKLDVLFEQIKQLEITLDDLKNKGIIEKDNLVVIDREIRDHRYAYEKNINADLQKLYERVEVYKKQTIAEISKKIFAVQSKIKQLNEKANLKQTSFLYETEIKILTDKLDEVKSKIEKIVEFESDINFNEVIKGQIESINIEITNLEEDLQNFAVQSKVNKIEIDKNNTKILEYENIQKQLKGEFERDKLFKLYVDIHSKGGLSMQILSEISDEINSEFVEIFQEDEFLPSIQILDEDINFIFKRDGAEFDMIEGSGEEKTLMSLSLHYILLSKMDIPIGNIFILDEVFSAIANINLANMFKIVERMLNIFPTILLITHNEEIAQWSDKSIKITKNNNISKII